MKLAIITWCNYHNFGTFLQAYALQTFLKGLGYEVTIIDDYEFSVKRHLWACFKFSVKTIVKKLFFHSKWQIEKIDKESDVLYDVFKRKYLIVDFDIIPLQKLNDRYSAFICGSDQIWNPGGFLRDGNDFYFASFASKPKIAYAPSLGVKEIPLEHRVRFSQLISDFSFLSTRERIAAKVLTDISNKRVDTVVDPTLLLDRQDWYRLVDVYISSEKYIFVYLLTYNQVYFEKAKEYANKYNLKLRIVKPCGVNIPIDEIESAGPMEFLKMIAGASYVMTDSFHAAIFSLIYRKQFVVFKRFRETNTLSQNSRLEYLLNMADLYERLIDEENLNNIYSLQIIDFKIVDVKLNNYITHSRDYLQNALKTIDK